MIAITAGNMTGIDNQSKFLIFICDSNRRKINSNNHNNKKFERILALL